MRSASTSRISDPRQFQQQPKALGDETMNAEGVSRGMSRAAPVPESRDLTFLGSDGVSDRPVVYAKASMGEPPKKGMRQAAPAGSTAAATHAPLSIDEAKQLRDAIVMAQPGAQSFFKTKGCPGFTQDTFTKLADLKNRLDNFLSTAREGNTFPVNAEDLDLMDKLIACAIQAQKAPDPWAYVILGGAVVGTVLAVSLSK